MEEVKDLLLWWLQHERHFLVVGYLTRIILRIPSDQIETKKVFSILGINQRWFGSKSLDLIVLLIKIWLNDPIVDVHDKRYVDEFGEIETCILYFMDVKFPKEVDDHVE